MHLTELKLAKVNIKSMCSLPPPPLHKCHNPTSPVHNCCNLAPFPYTNDIIFVPHILCHNLPPSPYKTAIIIASLLHKCHNANPLLHKSPPPFTFPQTNARIITTTPYTNRPHPNHNSSPPFKIATVLFSPLHKCQNLLHFYTLFTQMPQSCPPTQMPQSCPLTQKPQSYPMPCSRRAVQASSNYGPWVPPPLLSSRTLPASNQPVRGGIKDSACPVSVPCAEKCWSTPIPWVYMLKSVLLFP